MWCTNTFRQSQHQTWMNEPLFKQHFTVKESLTLEKNPEETSFGWGNSHRAALSYRHTVRWGERDVCQSGCELWELKCWERSFWSGDKKWIWEFWPPSRAAREHRCRPPWKSDTPCIHSTLCPLHSVLQRGFWSHHGSRWTVVSAAWRWKCLSCTSGVFYFMCEGASSKPFLLKLWLSLSIRTSGVWCVTVHVWCMTPWVLLLVEMAARPKEGVARLVSSSQLLPAASGSWEGPFFSMETSPSAKEAAPGLHPLCEPSCLNPSCSVWAQPCGWKALQCLHLLIWTHQRMLRTLIQLVH